MAFSPDGTQILTSSWDKTAKLWDPETGEEIRAFVGHTDCVNSAAFNADGTQVLTGSHDDTAKLWNAKTGELIRTFTGHTDAVMSVAIRPDGLKVLTSCYDFTAKMRDPRFAIDYVIDSEKIGISDIYVRLRNDAGVSRVVRVDQDGQQKTAARQTWVLYR